MRLEGCDEEALHGYGRRLANIAEIIKTKGVEKVKLEDLTEEMLPRGKALVPEGVKIEMLQKVQGFIESDPEYQKLYDF